MNDNVAGVIRTKNIITNKFFRTSLFNRTFQNFIAFEKLPPDIDKCQLCLNRIGGTHHALNELMRILMNDLAILEGSRLRFITITNEIDWFARLAIQKLPLHSGWKSGAATTAHTRFQHLRTDFFRLH